MLLICVFIKWAERPPNVMKSKIKQPSDMPMPRFELRWYLAVVQRATTQLSHYYVIMTLILHCHYIIALLLCCYYVIDVMLLLRGHYVDVTLLKYVVVT